MTQIFEKLKSRTCPLVVAEIAQGHDGSLGMAHAYIDALADVGVDAIKFQTHIADQESTLDEQFRVNFSYQDETRFDYWRRTEFSEAQWAELKRHADERGIAFISTPFSAAAVAMLERIGVPVWKIGSGDTALLELVELMAATGKPIIVSSGMSTWEELDIVVARLRQASVDFSLMQCTSRYPTPLDCVGLNNLPIMERRYECRVGLSDHSGVKSPSLAAIARGFSLIEVHAVFDKRMFGPDTAASLTIEEIKEVVQFAHDIVTLDANPVEKTESAAQLAGQKALFARSIGFRSDFAAGHLLRADDLLPKKPGTGIPWSERARITGRKLARSVSQHRLLRIEDLAE